MGIWITVAIVIFILGSIMGLKPSARDTYLDNLRMTARKVGLQPKLVACPHWIVGRTGEKGKGMIAQYGLIVEDGKMSPCDYQIIDDEWRPMTDNFSANFALDKHKAEITPDITPTIQGISCKANFICLYWQENVNMGNKANLEKTEKDLIFLKNELQKIANLVQNK